MITIKNNSWNVKNATHKNDLNIDINNITNNHIAVETLFELSKGLHAQRYMISFKHNDSFIDIISPLLDSVVLRLNSQHEIFSSLFLSDSFVIFPFNSYKYYVDQNSSSLIVTDMSEDVLIKTIKENHLLSFVLHSIKFVSTKLNTTRPSHRVADFFRSYINLNEDYLPSTHLGENIDHNPNFYDENSTYLKFSNLLSRQSKREAHFEITKPILIDLLQCFFSNNLKKIYPSAGASYEIYPLVTILSPLDNYEPGTYQIQNNQLMIKPNLTPDFSYHAKKMGSPSVIITLISNYPKIYKCYQNKALRLTIQNSGVLMASIHSLLSDLEISSCIYGLDLFSHKNLTEHHYEMGSIYIY